MAKFFGKIKNAITKDFKTVILAVGLAVFAWIMTTINVFPVQQTDISKIPVEVVYTDYMLDNNLQITSEIPKEATAYVEGERAVLAGLTADNFRAALDLSAVRGTGPYKVQVNILPRQDEDVSIRTVTPITVDITVDKIISKEFDLVPQAEGISIPADYKMGELVASPQKITVTGSERLINTIDYVAAKSQLSGDIIESYDAKADIILYNKSGAKIENEDLTKSIDTASVHIPIYKQKTLPLTFSFTNVPSNFNIKSLKYKIIPSEITISSPDDTIDNLSEINLGVLDLSTINPDSSTMIPITLPSGYGNLSGNTTAKIMFENEDYGKLSFEVDNISIINAPNNFDIKSLTNVINYVNVIGPSEDVAALTSSDIYATANLLGVTVKEGIQEVGISFTITTSTKSWVTGTYKISIEATEKTE